MSDNELYGETESNSVRWLPYVHDEWSSQPFHADNIEQLLKSLLKIYHLDSDADTVQSEILQLLSGASRRGNAKPEHGMSDLHASVETLAKKIRALEARTSIHGSLIDELEFKVNLTPHEEKIDKVLNCAREAFKNLDFVTSLHYIPLENGTLRMIIIHELDDRVKALDLTQDKQMDVERAFKSMSFQMLLLHVSEVRPDHLLGTKQIIPKLG